MNSNILYRLNRRCSSLLYQRSYNTYNSPLSLAISSPLSSSSYNNLSFRYRYSKQVVRSFSSSEVTAGEHSEEKGESNSAHNNSNIGATSLKGALKPREVVEQLNKFIVGQADAKRAVAIALRNRWRRHQLSDDLKNEVIPKNILMIGILKCIFPFSHFLKIL